jgi:choline kinase
MNGIVIAAGVGSRMGTFTENKPKCLLPVAGTTVLEHTIAQLRAVGCSRILVVVGHKADTINVPDVEYVDNDDYTENNILHSLMKAREHLNGPVMVSYSDIWVEPWIYRQLADTPGDIVLAIDRDWEAYFDGRTHHPVSEAENVFFDDSDSVLYIGKHLDPDDAGDGVCGEFTGLWRMSAQGSDDFQSHFQDVDAQLGRDATFQNAARWRQAYVTDLFQELVDRGHRVSCSVFERGWAELDTAQDYERLTKIAQRQLLTTIVEAETTDAS